MNRLLKPRVRGYSRPHFWEVTVRLCGSTSAPGIKKKKERPQLITGKIQNISVSLARDFSVNVIATHAPTACRNKTLNPPGVRMSEKVCVYLRWSVFGREEKESGVRVTAELDPQVTGAEASSQNDRFPHPPISSPGSHTLLVLTPALRYHTETCRSLCM